MVRQRQVDDHQWQPTETSVVTTYDAAGHRRTAAGAGADAGGHVATIEARVDIAPHRELGAMRRITAGGQPVTAIALSADGSKALVTSGDDSDPDTEPAIATGQAAVLDLATGEWEVATVRPDGDPMGSRWIGTHMSPNARWVAFQEVVDGGRLAPLRPRHARGPEDYLVYRTTDGKPSSRGVEDVTDDGRVLVVTPTPVPGAVPESGSTPCDESAWCYYLTEVDVATGRSVQIDLFQLPPQPVPRAVLRGRHDRGVASS